MAYEIKNIKLKNDFWFNNYSIIFDKEHLMNSFLLVI